MSFDTDSRSSTTTSSAVGGTTRTRYTGASPGVVVNAFVWTNRIARLLQRGASLTVRWVRSTVAPAGWVAILAASVGLVVGLSLGWAEFVAAGFISITLLLCAAPFLFGAKAYTVHLQLGKEHVVAGSDVRGSIVVMNSEHHPSLPGRIDLPVGEGLVEIDVPLLRAQQQFDHQIEIAAYRRGVITVGPATTVRGDPIGLLRREVAWAEQTELFVHPATTPIPSMSTGFIRDLEGNPSSNIVDADISFHAIREYMPGDSQRLIHWKSTARSGKLMVRQFEESRRSLMAVTLSVRDDEFGTADEFELAVSVAGSLGVRALRDGRDIAVVCGAVVPEFVRRTVRSVRELRAVSSRTLLDDLAIVESHPQTMPLRDVCATIVESQPQISLAFLVCGSTVTLKALQSAALAFPSDVAVVAVICNPESEPGVSMLGQLTVMTIGILDDLRHLMARGSQS